MGHRWCVRCGGYGEHHVNDSDSHEKPRFRLVSCTNCGGLGFITGSRVGAVINNTTRTKTAMKSAINAIEGVFSKWQTKRKA